MNEKSPDKLNELCPPAKVTLAWLFKHVPWELWTAAFGILAATFWAGVECSDLSLIREIRGKPPLNTPSTQSEEGFVHCSAIELESSQARVPGSTGIVRSGGTTLRLSPSLDADGPNIQAGVRLNLLKVDGEWVKVKVIKTQ